MGQRSLRVHAPGALKRRRTRALQAPKSDGRARVRAEQIQPWLPPLPATRQSRGALGVAPAGGSPQPTQAPQPLDQPRGHLTGTTRAPARVASVHAARIGAGTTHIYRTATAKPETREPVSVTSAGQNQRKAETAFDARPRTATGPASSLPFCRPRTRLTGHQRRDACLAAACV